MRHFLIIGNSAAGVAAVEAIRKRDNTSAITVVSDEDYPTYCRCLISYYLAGDIKEDKVIYRAADFYKENNIELLLNKKALRVDPKKSRMIFEDKSQLEYDSLLIATGASPKFPQDIKGIKKRGVFGFRTIKDAKEIEGLLPVTKTVCVLGGGLIGLKCAYALKKKNIDVKIIIKSQQVLSQMLDAQSSGLLQQRLEANGLGLILGQDVSEIIGEGDIKAVKLESGKVLGCSLVVVGKGVSPNVDIAKDTEIKINQGIEVNEFLRSNVENIYAAGDVCESFDISLGRPAINALWPVAVEQGKIAGANMAGENFSYEGSVGMNSVDFFGLPIISLGAYKLKDFTGCQELTKSDLKRNIYTKLIIKDNFLIGAILAGDIKHSGVLLRLIRERVNIDSIKERLLSDNFSFADILDLVKEKEKIYY